MSIDPWLRNWRNPDEYNLDEGVPIERWAWEFLRRNSDYQADWNHYVSACADFYGFPPEKAYEGENCLFLGLASFESANQLSVFVPQKDASESTEDWRKRNGESARYVPLSRWLGNKWCLTQIVAPSTDSGYMHFAPQPRFRHTVTRNGVTIDGGYHGIQEPPLDHFACDANVLFDLSIPIDPQLNYLREELQFIQESLRRTGQLIEMKPVRLRADKYSTYLRILDAVTSGIEAKQICEVLMPRWHPDRSEYPPEKLLARQLGEARRLVEGGYRALIGKTSSKN